jgi:hypothetical protein
MRFRQHVLLIENIIESRGDVVVERLSVEEVVGNSQGIIEGRVRFWDGSMLAFVEALAERGVILHKLDYAYHYQDAEGKLIFRYDNAPHHPGVPTHPHHKHTVEGVVSAEPPHFGEVLSEIDGFLYPTSPES